eukprot:SAG22_NODE_135_length_18211_cov_560.916519_11_plen_150_part_00
MACLLLVKSVPQRCQYLPIYCPLWWGRRTEHTAGLKAALLGQAWNGQYLRRAWLGPEIKWVGTSPAEAAANGSNVTLYSAPVGWALLADAFAGRPAAQRVQVAALLAQCRNADWPLGLGYRCNNTADPRPGSGMWPAVNHVGLASPKIP